MRYVLLGLIAVLVYMAGPYVWARYVYSYARADDGLSVALVYSQRGSLLTRYYVDGPPYKLRVSLSAGANTVTAFRLEGVTLVGIESKRAISLREARLAEMSSLVPLAGSQEEGSYGVVLYEVGDVPYEDYRVSGMIQKMVGGEIVSEETFSVVLRAEYEDSFRWSRLWDALMSV